MQPFDFAATRLVNSRTAAEAGPSDLTDRSGAMTKAAGDNFGAGEVDASAVDAQRIADGEGATWKPNL